jgi:hypothetical protein
VVAPPEVLGFGGGFPLEMVSVLPF